MKHYATVRKFIEDAARTSCPFCAAIQCNWPLDETQAWYSQEPQDDILDLTGLEFSLMPGPESLAIKECDPGQRDSPVVNWSSFEIILHSERHGWHISKTLSIVTCVLNRKS